ncbi:MAG: peptidoglycan editing factor PgeF [Gammaproteobacteria bacterium]|nr:peptidoglycan editing factor PgeF [Gammaproteobacteria bacterium]
MKLFSATWPAPNKIKTLITTRQGGFSLPPFDSFNLALHVEDKPEHVEQNRQLLTKKLPASPTWLDQQHTINCINIDNQKFKQPSVADASLTTKMNSICVVLTADCMPLLVCNKNATIVAAIHAGWKGMVDGIIEKSILQILTETQESADELMVWLGPAISQNNFEVGLDVKDAFVKKHPKSIDAFKSINNKPDKFLCDLYQISRLILNHLGVTQIYSENFCTYADKENFYSYRRDGQTGRMASLIWME